MTRSAPVSDADLEALLECLALKALPRAGWVRCGLTAPESVAAHSWGVAWLVTVLLPAHLDRGRALTYAVLHDLAEVRTGDITPHDGVSADAKATLEASAIDGLFAPLPAHLHEAWRSYEAQADDEARFVRQLDRLDMALQASAYARAGMEGAAAFFDSAAKVITDPTLRALLDRLRTL
jgi:putative hydrolase of HD superfamily